MFYIITSKESTSMENTQHIMARIESHFDSMTDLEKTRQENEEKAQAALSNKKEVLLQMIVDRVVEKYGH